MLTIEESASDGGVRGNPARDQPASESGRGHPVIKALEVSAIID